MTESGDPALGAVAPDLRAFIELLPDLSNIGERLDEIRAMLGGEEPELGNDGDVVAAETLVPRPDGSHLRVLSYRPVGAADDAALPAVLHIHGGGYVAGSANRDDAYARDMASQLQCVVVNPDYRLAPEHPFPEPLDDVLLAWQWMHGSAKALGIETTRMAIQGVSAGGGLACAAALKLREQPNSAPCFLVLVFPMLDDRTPPHAHNGVYVWTHDNNRFGWDSYLGDIDRSDPPAHAVPGRVDDVSGLPPTFLAAGSIDLFVGENLDLARKLVDAGIALELHLYPGAYHGFPLVPCEAGSAFARDASRALTHAFSTDNIGENE